MKKIIVKAEVRDVDKLENRLMNLGYDFDPMYWQHSRIFVPRNYDFKNGRKGSGSTGALQPDL